MPYRPKTTIAEVLAAYRALNPDAKRSGGEWKGFCPVCGGEDRFWISETKLGCRGCCPGKNNPDAFVAILKALGMGASHERDLPAGVVKRANATHERWRYEREMQERKTNEVRRAWDRSTPSDGTPGAVYLCYVRLCWPPAVALPTAVRWLERAHLPFTSGLPRDAAGAVAYVFVDDKGTVVSLDLEALTAKGQQPTHRWRRTCGLKGRGLFYVEAPGAELQITEGAVSALAARWLRNAAAAATGGTGVNALAAVHWPRVRIHVDGDRAGRKYALTALDVLPSEVTVDIERYAPGTDAADQLKGIVLSSDMEKDQKTVHNTIQAGWNHYLSQS